MSSNKFTSRFFRRNREVERGYFFDSPAKKNSEFREIRIRYFFNLDSNGSMYLP